MTWIVQLFQSGSVIVKDDASAGPWFYLHTANIDLVEDANDAFRYNAAKDMEKWLNQSEGCLWQPWWSYGMERDHSAACRSRGPGVSIEAVGPMHDPSGRWSWVQLPEDDSARSALIDMLMAKAARKTE